MYIATPACAHDTENSKLNTRVHKITKLPIPCPKFLRVLRGTQAGSGTNETDPINSTPSPPVNVRDPPAHVRAGQSRMFRIPPEMSSGVKQSASPLLLYVRMVQLSTVMMLYSYIACPLQGLDECFVIIDKASAQSEKNGGGMGGRADEPLRGKLASWLRLGHCCYKGQCCNV